MEKIIDSHLHCSFCEGEKQSQIEQLKEEMRRNRIEKAVLYLINEKDFEEKNYALDWGTEIIPGVMLNPKDKDIEQKLDELEKHQIRFVKLLPYEQKLFYEDFEMVSQYAKKVQEHNMILTICGSYGSKYLYSTNGVELAAKILLDGFSNPLILAHGGMPRVLDTYALMLEYPNLYMDICYTLPCWWGTHIIQDYYFVMEKMKYERVFWGSDYPYHSHEEELSMFNLFCKTYHIRYENRIKILSQNFERFSKKYLE